MIAPLPIYRRTLTGRVRGRRTWRNKLLMQVEVRCDELHCWPRPTAGGQELQIKGTHYEWRDAKVDDMLGGIYSLTPNAKLTGKAGTPGLSG